MSDLKNKKQQKVTIRSTTVNKDVSMISLAWELGYMIAIPIVVFSLGGALLDRQMGTSPWMLLLGVGSSIILTSFMVYYKMMKILGIINGVNESGESSDDNE
jgi:F0F1-type ATP synthase assembly protein I